MSGDTNDWAARRRRNKRRLCTWTFSWLLSLAIASFGPVLVWEGNKAVSIIAIELNAAVGVGLVAGLGYPVLDIADVIGAHAEISHLVMLLGLTYSFAIAAGMRRLR